MADEEETKDVGPDPQLLDALENALDPTTQERVYQAVDCIVAAKERGRGVVVVTGSGPNLHEGVTTLVAELMRQGIVDGVSTSSAVVAHEMGGTLDRVKRCDGRAVGVAAQYLPRGGQFELTELDEGALACVAEDVSVDLDLIERLRRAEGVSIIKAAGNLGYPMGLWLEALAPAIANLARERRLSFEQVAGLGADERTMIGAGARFGLPVVVTVPQLVGGGAVGLAIGDSMSISERSRRLATMLGEAEVIIESAVALTQEAHDGPLERYTGHGLWAAWQGQQTISLEAKALIRIDLDPALEQVWRLERESAAVQRAIAEGLPKTKAFGAPFRMEMSGFARLEGSVPIVGDIGAIWPILARRVAERLGLDLQFMSYPQETPRGQAMREWIVREIRPLDKARMLRRLTG